ncbi:DUF1822 family protein [Thermosynechococcaceae cyanobacterium Okahandja]
MTFQSTSFRFLPNVPLIEHVEIDLSACDAGDRRWIERVSAAARPHCRGRVHLNALAYIAAKQWLRDMGLEARPITPVDELELPLFWEFINGTALDTPFGRLVILPEEVASLEEWLVPREWVDIPAWRPDYFMGVQVLPHEESLEIKLWGYACAREVARDTYDPLLRTYTIERDQMVEDVGLLLVLPERQPQSLPLAEPKLVSAEVIQRIASGEILLPRLVLPLDEWAQLMSQPQHRLTLFLACHPHRLGLWLRAREYAIRDSLQPLWQELTPLWQELTAALCPKGWWGYVRSADPQLKNGDSVDPSVREAIAAVEQLRQIRAMPNAAERQAILKSLISQPPNEDIRWQAAELLHEINDTDPSAGAWKVRKVDLGVEMAGIPLALTMAILPRDATTAHLFVRVTPFSPDTFLPAGLNLSIVTETGDCFARLTSRAEDQVVQYKFWGDIGESFGIVLEYGSAKIAESFVV